MLKNNLMNKWTKNRKAHIYNLSPTWGRRGREGQYGSRGGGGMEGGVAAAATVAAATAVSYGQGRGPRDTTAAVPHEDLRGGAQILQVFKHSNFVRTLSRPTRQTEMNTQFRVVMIYFIA
jgi:hypothetical protein